VEGARPRGGSKKTWTEIVEKDCKLNRDRNLWRKQIRMTDDHNRCEW